MKFVLRDDDACAFTEATQILDCYAEILNEVPVTLAVTPFRVPGPYRFIPKERQAEARPIPLHENEEFTGFLRQEVAKARLHVAMHGYHHIYRNGVPEYALDEDLLEKTRAGRRYLEELLGCTVASFVPPSNRVGRRGFRAVVEAGMNLVNVPSLYHSSVRGVSLAAFLSSPRYYWHRKLNSRKYPFVLEFGDHKEVEYHTAGPLSRTDELIRELDYCHDHGGVFVLATHYHAFDLQTGSGDSVRETVMAVLDRAASKTGIEFVGINAIW